MFVAYLRTGHGGLDVTDKPGVQYSYRSGETQLLAFVVEAATRRTLSEYAEEKLWKPMQAERDAYWLLDKKDGDEKAFCCAFIPRRATWPVLPASYCITATGTAGNWYPKPTWTN